MDSRECAVESLVNSLDKNFWYKKRVLITGHTGFKGSWLILLLRSFDAEIFGVSLNACVSEPNLFEQANLINVCESSFFNIVEKNSLNSAIEYFKPEVIFHLAAQSLVINGVDNPIETFEINTFGTLNLLETLRKSNLKPVVIVVTSDKVYKNKEDSNFFHEGSELGGDDPYSASKAAAEILVESYSRTYFSQSGIPIGTARAGNVIGGGDWSDNRLVPDLIRAFNSKTVASIRNSTAIRPWQFVLDPLVGYLQMAEYLFKSKSLESFNFGPDSRSLIPVNKFLQLVTERNSNYKYKFENQPHHSIEKSILKLKSKKAKKILGYRQNTELRTTIDLTFNWYERFYQGENARSITEEMLLNYLKTSI